jgi:hypothetical protein
VYYTLMHTPNDLAGPVVGIGTACGYATSEIKVGQRFRILGYALWDKHEMSQSPG